MTVITRTTREDVAAHLACGLQREGFTAGFHYEPESGTWVVSVAVAAQDVAA